MVLIRIHSTYKAFVQSKFVEIWEPKLFEYLESDETSKVFLNSLLDKQITNFFSLIRNYLNLLKGKDFERLSNLIESKKVISYLEKSLSSFRLRKKIEAIYFLGIFKKTTSKNKIAKYLNSKNDELFSHSARSLARMDAREYIKDFLKLSLLHKKISSDTIYSILIEFQKEACSEMYYYFDKHANEKLQIIILSVFTHFKFSGAINKALELLLYSHHKGLVIQCLKYFEALEYREAANALRFIFLKPSTEIISQAIKTASKITNSELEKMIHERIFEFSWQNKIDAANALYEMSEASKSKLKQLAENKKFPLEASIAQMVISQRELV